MSETVAISADDRHAVDVLKTKAAGLTRVSLPPGTACVARAADALEEAAAILRDAADNCYDIAVIAAREDDG